MEIISTWLPYAIILTAYSVPQRIFAATLIEADKFKRIDFLPDSSPLSYGRQTLDRLPEGIPCFVGGAVSGFYE